MDLITLSLKLLEERNKHQKNSESYILLNQAGYDVNAADTKIKEMERQLKKLEIKKYE